MALKTFSATRAADAVGKANTLRFWHIAALTAPCAVDFCNGTSATPIFRVHLTTALTSASETFPQPGISFPNGLHIELITGTLNSSAIDI